MASAPMSTSGPAPQRGPAHQGRARDTRSLALGSAVSGLLAYLVFALTTRALGADAAGPVSVLWSYWAFAGAAFTFPLQHWIARTVAVHGPGAVRRTLPRLSAALLAGSVALGALAWLARDPLFHRDDLAFPAMVAAVTLGSAVTGGVRGGLSADGRFAAVAGSLVAENAVRCVVAGTLLAVGDHRVVDYGLGLVAGHLVMAAWPAALRFARDPDDGQAPDPFAFLAGASLAQLVGQVVLTGSPVLLALVGGTPRQVTTLFTALALFRAPYMLALGMVASLTTRVAGLVADGRVSTMRTMRRRLRVATAATAVLAALGAAGLGPWLLRLVFGADVVLGRTLTALVAVGCTVAVANLLLMVSALAQARSGPVARCWLGAVVVAAVGYAALTSLGVAAETTVVAGFGAAEVAAFVLLSLVERREPSPQRPVDVG